MRFVALPFVLVALLMVGVPAQAANTGVTVGSSNLIDEVDYSDTFTGTDAGGIDDRAWHLAEAPAAFPLSIVDYPANGTPGEGLAVENCYANPQLQWANSLWSINADDNVWPTTTSPYPGTSGAGSDTGFTQTGGGMDGSIAYNGLRTDFVVQMDAVQTTDRVNIWISPNTNPLDPGALAVFFRASDYTGGWGKIGIYHNGEFDSGLTSIAPIGEWHNYAVHFMLDDNKLEIFTDEISLGVVDLAALLPDTNFSNARVGYGAAGNDRTWTDNFQVGSRLTIIPSQASKPSPGNKAADVCRDVVLTWTPGEYAPATNGHKVFFSQDFDNVNDGAPAADRGPTSDPEFDTADLPFDLDFETTYYWRIDEANTVSGWDEGPVWQFLTEPLGYQLPNDQITATADSNAPDQGPENTINGSGLSDDLHSKDEEAMWLSALGASQPNWIEYKFDKVYRLHEMWVWNHNTTLENTIGLGVKNAMIEYSTDGENYSTLGTTHEFARAPGTDGYAHNTEISFEGVAAQYIRITANSNWGGFFNQSGLSEVRFFYSPVQARLPEPKNEAVEVAIDVTLNWREGREAATHELYFSSDRQAVADSTVDPCSIPAGGTCQASYGPLSLELGKTYYWKVNEVNSAEEPNTWEGDVWSFSTPEYVVVEDFEDYNDTAGFEVFSTWSDGWQVDANGSQIGYSDAPYLEQTIVHGGSWSAPYYFNNIDTVVNVVNSEVTRTFSSPQDWTTGGIRALTLFFYGQEDNTTPSAGEQMYVKLNGVKVAYDGDMADIKQPQWHEWAIDLAAFGVNLQNVTTIRIGFDRGADPASGLVYFDDIRLYPTRCVLSRRSADFALLDFAPEGRPGGDCVVNYREIEVMTRDWLLTDSIVYTTAPDDANLVVYYEFEGDCTDSSSYTGYHDGEPIGGPGFTGGVFGQAIELNGANQSVRIPHSSALQPTNEITISAWVKPDNITATTYSEIYRKNDPGLQLLSFQIGGTILSFGLDVGGVYAELDVPINPLNYTDGDWHLITATYDGSNKRIYADGVQIGLAPQSGTINNGGGTVDAYLGSSDGLNEYLDGKIDNFRFYSRALSQAEVAYLADLTPGDGQLYVPVGSIANIYNEEPPLSRSVNFRDYAVLAERWLDRDEFPPE